MTSDALTASSGSTRQRWRALRYPSLTITSPRRRGERGFAVGRHERRRTGRAQAADGHGVERRLDPQFTTDQLAQGLDRAAQPNGLANALVFEGQRAAIGSGLQIWRRRGGPYRNPPLSSVVRMPPRPWRSGNRRQSI